MSTKSGLSSLEEYAFIRVLNELKEYSNSGYNLIKIKIPEQAAAFGSYISIEFILDIESDTLSLRDTQPAQVLNVWTVWPLSQDQLQNQKGISIFDVKAQLLPNGLHLPITIQQQERSTSLYLDLSSDVREHLNSSSKIKIQFTTPNIYLMMPERQPFSRSILNVRFEFTKGPSNVLLDLEHPSELSLRTRVDNSKYHSLAYSEQVGSLRKLTFYNTRIVALKWYFGTSNTKKLLAPTGPLIAASISAFAVAFSFLLHGVGLEDLAATVFAIALIPPAFSLYVERRILFPSADIRRISFSEIAAYFSIPVYFAILLNAVAVFVFFPHLQQIGIQLSLVFGGLSFTLVIIYMGLVLAGTLQKYTCDKCEKRIYFRPNAKLDIPTRKTLCKRCWQESETQLRALADTKE